MARTLAQPSSCYRKRQRRDRPNPGSLRLRLDTGAEITVVVIAGETIVVPAGTVVTTTTTTTTTVPPTTTTTTTVPPTTTTTTTVRAATTTTTTLPAATTGPPASEPDETGDPLAALSIDKALDGPLRSGLVATYVLTVTNLGPSPTNGTITITITDDLPSGLEYASSTAPAGTTCIDSTSAVTCKTAASIPVDGTVTVTIEARVVAGSGTRVVNVATVEGGNEVNGTPVPGDQVRAAGAQMSASVSATVESTGSLPFTGSSWVRLLSAVGLVLLVIGAALLAARHRLRRST